MPVISYFYGIIIKMYFQQAEHNPPHVHVQYSGNVAEINIKTNDVLSGSLPPKALSLVNEWISIHREELLNIWDTQEFISLPPLE